MKYLANMQYKVMKHSALLLGFLLYFGVQTSLFAQVDSFGSLDRMYIDNISAVAGTDVAVHFYMQNDETISSASIPITYNPDYLTLDSVDFGNSRIEYIANKIISPSQPSDIHGHFMISFFVLLEDAVPAGDGLLCTAHFTVADSAALGNQFSIDTLFYPPGGEFIFVEATQSTIIVPQFEAGSVLVEQENFAPAISAAATESVFEGDSLAFVVSASDINNDSLVFVCSNKPTGSTFKMIDNNSALFSWTPGFVGPYSADGSPFKLNLWVSDGKTSSETEVLIHVVNKNRKPVISTVSNLSYESGDNVEILLDASDADFDSLTWNIVSMPDGAVFSEGSQSTVSWQTTLNDTGSYPLEFIVTDPYGFSDTLTSSIYLAPTVAYELSMTNDIGYPGDKVSIDINLDNKLPIGSFNLLINYDPSALSLLSITNDSSRTSSFEYFSYVKDVDNIIGNVRIIGVADLSGNNSTYLANGNGAIAALELRIFGNINLSGINIPVKFMFLDEPVYNDNTFEDTLGVKIEQGAITYINGSVQVESLGEVLIGDINLNGIAFDIGDAIYFTNFFMNPFTFPFNPLQYANSDVNRDNIVGSIADLVSLINIISTGGTQAPKRATEEKILTANIITEKNDNGTIISYDADFSIGGILITVAGGSLSADDIENVTDNMTIDFAEGADSSRILVYSLDGNSMPSGNYSFVQLHSDSDVEILSIEAASSDGVLAAVENRAKEVVIPTSFELSQNYPNPFNPETNISFSLPNQTDLTLEIFNILGKKVRVLIDDTFAAGHHVVTWDGRNDTGVEVASGVYFYRMQTETNFQTKKMLFLK